MMTGIFYFNGGYMNSKKNNDSNTEATVRKLFPTTHIFCAAYLLCLGYRLDHIDRDYGSKVMMHFEGDDAEQEAMNFFNGTAKKIDPKKYSEAYRSAKDFLFER